jgi:hypothetical protein
MSFFRLLSPFWPTALFVALSPLAANAQAAKPKPAQPQPPAQPMPPTTSPTPGLPEQAPPSLGFASGEGVAVGETPDADGLLRPADPDAVTVLGEPSESSSGFEARILAGFSLPAIGGEFNDTYDPGYEVGVELGGRISRLHLALGFYHSQLFLRDESLLSDPRLANIPPPTDGNGFDSLSLDVDGGNLLLFELLALARFDLAERVFRPYLLGGAGVAMAIITDLEATLRLSDGETSIPRDGETQVGPTAYVGIGIRETLGPVDLFAQLKGQLLLLDETGFVAGLDVGAAFGP